MGSLYAEALPEIGAIRVVLDIRDFTDVAEQVQLIRSTNPPGPDFAAAGVRVRVRPTYALDTEYPSMGFPWEMTAGGVDVWYDTEAPIGVPVWYEAELPGADDAFIYSQAAIVLADYTFEGGIAGWAADVDATISYETAAPINGVGSLRMAVVGTPSVTGTRAARVDVTAGRRYSLTALLRASSGTGLVRLAVDWFTAGNVYVSTSYGSQPTPPAGVEVYRSAVLLAPPTAARADVVVLWGTPPAAGVVIIDDVRLLDIGASTEDGTPVTLTVDGAGWLSDPELPAGDVRLDLLPTDECEAPTGVVFASHDADSRAGVGSRYDVIDQAAPAIITGRRKLPTSALTLAALSFADRDRVHELLATGNQLLLRLVDEYGIADRYLDVGDVKTDALSPDLRLPYRVLDLPYAQSSSPAGPTGGVLGIRLGDLDRYPTWDEFDAAELTSIDLLHGAGSTLGLGA